MNECLADRSDSRTRRLRPPLRAQLSAIIRLVLTGCGTRALSPRSPESVEIFSTAQPQRAFVEAGIIETQQESLYRNDAYPAQASQYGGSGRTLKDYRGACIDWSAIEASVTAPAEGTTTL